MWPGSFNPRALLGPLGRQSPLFTGVAVGGRSSTVSVWETCLSEAHTEAEPRAGERTPPAIGRTQLGAQPDQLTLANYTDHLFVLHLGQLELDFYLITQSLT